MFNRISFSVHRCLLTYEEHETLRITLLLKKIRVENGSIIYPIRTIGKGNLELALFASSFLNNKREADKHSVIFEKNSEKKSISIINLPALRESGGQ